jgi:hypothetical protein
VPGVWLGRGVLGMSGEVRARGCGCKVAENLESGCLLSFFATGALFVFGLIEICHCGMKWPLLKIFQLTNINPILKPSFITQNKPNITSSNTRRKSTGARLAQFK